MQSVYHFLKIIIDFFFPLEDAAQFVELQRNDIPLDSSIMAIFSYKDDKVKELIWNIKYYRNEYSAQIVAEEMRLQIARLAIPKPFEIVPIPMSEASKKQRGYNQTEFIARKLLPLLDQESCSGISLDLKKVHTFKPQHTLARADRINNAKGMFYVENKNCFSGKNILVIDDVVTTGSTLKEAIKTIRANGADNVLALAVAH